MIAFHKCQDSTASRWSGPDTVATKPPAVIAVKSNRKPYQPVVNWKPKSYPDLWGTPLPGDLPGAGKQTVGALPSVAGDCQIIGNEVS